MPTPPPPSLFPKLVNDAGSEDRSSQLPSVDEAKLQASLKSPQSRTVSASDDDSLPGIKQSGTDRTSFDYGFDDDEEMSVHDQLPALEDMKLYANDNGRRCGTNAKVLGFCVVFLLACAVLVMIVLLGVPVDDEAPRISSSSSSSSSSSNGGDEGVGFPEQPSAPANQSVVVLDDTDTADSTTSATSEETEMITEEPTETPYVDRYTHLIEILSNGGISSMEDLVAPGSPQQKAAQFIANDDGRQISLAAENKSSLIQRYVLTVMYHGLGGEQWTNRLNFLANDDECNWFVLGLGPDKKTQTYGVSCFRSGNVQTLHFRKLLYCIVLYCIVFRRCCFCFENDGLSCILTNNIYPLIIDGDDHRRQQQQQHHNKHIMSPLQPPSLSLACSLPKWST